MTECERLVSEGVIPDDFLKEENRSDYHIPISMKKVWAIEIDLLLQFTKVCRENNIRFWVIGGTLLGAVRHSGFIPWDDDIDITMPRDDYERLLKLPTTTFCAPYFLQTPLNDNDYYCSFARLRNSMTTAVTISKSNNCNNGIYLDIIPLDGYEKFTFLSHIRNTIIRTLNFIAHTYAYKIKTNIVRRLVCYFFNIPFFKIDLKKMYKVVDSLAKKIPWDKTNYVGNNLYSPYSMKKNKFKKKDFAETKWIPFEFIEVPIPIGYDHVLSTLMGNYMELPPIEKRGVWHSWKYEPDISFEEMVIK